MATKYAPQLKPSHGQNPFDSPGLSVNSIEDTESGNTSGQDEFHLERYSEGLRWDEERRTPGHQKPARQPSRRAREPSSRKRPRPGLNIITDFSKPVGRAFTDGVVLDQVKAQRPEVGQRPMLTARSQTVEHVRAEPQPPQWEGPGFVSLNDLVDLRKKEKKEKSPPKNQGYLAFFRMRRRSLLRRIRVGTRIAMHIPGRFGRTILITSRTKMHLIII
jgi:hypothetical protein